MNSGLIPNYDHVLVLFLNELEICLLFMQQSKGRTKMVHYILQNILKVAYLKPFIHSLLLCQKIHYQFSYPTVAA